MISKSTKNILIPIDFSQNTEAVLTKVIDLIMPLNSMIYLLHIIKKPSQKNKESAEEKLQELKQNISKALPYVSISTKIELAKSIQQKIAEKANELNTELIVIVKNKNHKWFSFKRSINATAIAKRTNSAILIVNREAIPNKIKSVVLPVYSLIPEKNIELLNSLAGKHKPHIHLVAPADTNRSFYRTNVFLDTYRTLSDLYHYPVDYKIFRADNFSRLVAGYGKNIMADLVFVNPNEKVNSFYKNDPGYKLSSDSKFCVLIVKQTHNYQMA